MFSTSASAVPLLKKKTDSSLLAPPLVQYKELPLSKPNKNESDSSPVALLTISVLSLPTLTDWPWTKFRIYASNPVGDLYDIDYVAHEMGHQYGGPHTFNGNAPGTSCLTQRTASNAYEPGSGSTIMAYAGICPPQNVQNNSDDHFHSVSITSMWNHIQGTLCGTTTATGNNAPVANAGADFSVPRGTPLILKGNATLQIKTIPLSVIQE